MTLNDGGKLLNDLYYNSQVCLCDHDINGHNI